MSIKIKWIAKPSANFADQPIKPKYIIIHCIGFTQEKALTLLTQPPRDLAQAAVSSHFFIPTGNIATEDGYPIYQLVPENRKAFHAGVSQWQTDSNLNESAIGIEFHVPNYANALQVQAGTGNLDWLHFEDYDPQQVQAGISLIHALMQQYHILPEHVLGHSDVAPWRYDSQGEVLAAKSDPGATFPWELLASVGIGVWPKAVRTRKGPLNTGIVYVQSLLAELGYCLPITGELDRKTELTIQAFHWHYLPKQSSGQISESLVIRLENLVDKQYQF